MLRAANACIHALQCLRASSPALPGRRRRWRGRGPAVLLGGRRMRVPMRSPGRVGARGRVRGRVKIGPGVVWRVGNCAAELWTLRKPWPCPMRRRCGLRAGAALRAGGQRPQRRKRVHCEARTGGRSRRSHPARKRALRGARRQWARARAGEGGAAKPCGRGAHGAGERVRCSRGRSAGRLRGPARSRGGPHQERFQAAPDRKRVCGGGGGGGRRGWRRHARRRAAPRRIVCAERRRAQRLQRARRQHEWRAAELLGRGCQIPAGRAPGHHEQGTANCVPP